MHLLTTAEIGQLIGPFAFLAAMAGLALGIYVCRHGFEVDEWFTLWMLIAANAIGLITALVIIGNDFSPLGYETLGLVMALAFFAGFMGLGVVLFRRKPGQ
jgi:hypothetical protein